MVKTISNPRKINAILLNIKRNRQKLANMCGYKLAKDWQNSTEINLAYVKNISGGYFFYSHCSVGKMPFAFPVTVA